MNTQTMLKSKYYLVEMFTAKKQFRITVRKPLDTKQEATQFENSRVKAHNYKSLCKLIEQGYTDLNAINEEVVETIEENAVEINLATMEDTSVIDLTGNEEVEKAIANYTQAKIERDIEAYAQKKAKEEAKKANDEALKRFLSTPPQQPKFKPFDYTKAWDDYETNGKPKAEKALDKQMKEYKECEL